MKTCGALLALLCCCLTQTQLRGETISENDITHQKHYGEAETRENAVMGATLRTDVGATTSNQQICQPDILTVLREMSTLIGEQRVELRYTKTQMEAMENRLRASVEQLKSENAAQAVKLNLTVNQVEELRREREERKVSFSASLLPSGDGHTGPFSVATPLVYRHVITNVGNAYNPNTGVFTAPVRGVYHFVLFLYAGAHASTHAGVSLHKNGQHVVIVYSYHPSGTATPSNGASLLLEVGDVVYVKLWPNSWAYDSGNRHTTFSGHLLFAM